MTLCWPHLQGSLTQLSHPSLPPFLPSFLSSFPRLSDEGGKLEFSVVSEGSIPKSGLDPADGIHGNGPRLV